MKENMNDIFSDVTEASPLVMENLGASDGGIDVEIVNSAGNGKKSYHLYPENTIGEILNICKADVELGLMSTDQCHVEYNGTIYSDTNLSIGKIGVTNGSKLLINPNGMVA